MRQPKSPRDPFRYKRDTRSRPLAPGIQDGLYVYVQDTKGVIHVLPDGYHMHPRVLGDAEPALYAGDLRIVAGKVKDVTNLSGTFQFNEVAGLLEIAEEMEKIGLEVQDNAVRFFPTDGSAAIILR